MVLTMPHPYYGKKLKRRKSRVPWFVALLLLGLILAIPWFMPESVSKSGPLKYIKAVTTFPMVYEWTHTYRYEPPEETKPDESQGTTEPVVDDSLFPLAVGNKWVFEHKKTGGIMDTEEKVTAKTLEITEEKQVQEFHLYKAVSTEDNKVSSVWYYWDSNGLHVTKDDRRPWRHSLLVLKSSPQKGDTWLEGEDEGARSEVIGEEDLQISSGLYKCVLVETRVSKGEDQVYTTWYASGVGLVRQHFGSRARGEDSWELKNFTAR